MSAPTIRSATIDLQRTQGLQAIGAKPKSEWIGYRVDVDALAALAGGGG